MMQRLMVSVLICLLATPVFATNFTDLPDDFVPNTQTVEQIQPAREQNRDLTFWNDEGELLTLFPSLVFEGFDNTLVGMGEMMGCLGMISSTTDDECFEPGTIVEGIEIGALPDSALYVVIGEQAFGNFTPWIGPNTFEDALVARFDPPVAAFGCMFQMAIVACDINMEIYGPSGLIGTDTIFASMNTFWGVSNSADEMITEIIFTTALGEPKLVDYIWFGDGETVATQEATWDQLKSFYK